MKMIASVLHLDRAAVKALKITDPYSLHRVVYSLYDDVRSATEKQASVSSGILYADQGGDYHGRKILMLSNRQPKESVDGQYGQVLCKPIAENFLSHAQYRFQVTVNPTRRNNQSGNLMPIRERDEICRWFVERAAASWGFAVDVPSLQDASVEVLQFKDKQQRQVTIAQAKLQGFLRVTDREQFAHSFCHGIGRARAYGCGLLQIVPIMDNPFI